MPYEQPEPGDLFQCLQCGDCCRGFGGTALAEKDIENISGYLGIPENQFIEKYCTVSAGRYAIGQKEDGYCIFWNGLCTIHPVKPRMCMAWPFIENVLREPSNWDLMAQACPGMRTGFDRADIIRCVRLKLEELDRLREETPSFSTARESS